jgi:hypothetical protein
VCAPAISFDTCSRFLLEDITQKIIQKLDDIDKSIKDLSLSYAGKTGTIEVIGELDGVPAELVGEYVIE